LTVPNETSEYCDELTGATFTPESWEDRGILQLADVLANFPLALLVSRER
jgi:hypothetical protein